MNQRILIVEDQFLIAVAIEDAVVGLGYEIAGVAASRKDVASILEPVDIALVDVNLLDGPTGPQIGRELASRGCSVIFMTANPEAVIHGIEGTLGVISKPVLDCDLLGVLEFAAACREGVVRMPPRTLTLFGRTSIH